VLKQGQVARFDACIVENPLDEPALRTRANQREGPFDHGSQPFRTYPLDRILIACYTGR
jgi:hypothetical protein